MTQLHAIKSLRRFYLLEVPKSKPYSCTCSLQQRARESLSRRHGRATVEHVEDDQPTEHAGNDQVLNDGFFDTLEIGVLSDPFVGSTGAML
jgi:hypothetical protein